MSAATTAATAGDIPGRPAGPEPREHAAESVLSLSVGAGPDRSEEDQVARPVRFDDPAQNDAYWARVRRIVAAAPPLDDTQRAIIRAAFHQPQARRAAA